MNRIKFLLLCFSDLAFSFSIFRVEKMSCNVLDTQLIENQGSMIK